MVGVPTEGQSEWMHCFAATTVKKKENEKVTSHLWNIPLTSDYIVA